MMPSMTKVTPYLHHPLLLIIIISPQHRSAAGVVQLLGKMYALGGHNGLSIFDSVEEYDTQTECWAETVPMLSKRCRLGVGRHNHNMEDAINKRVH